MNEYLKLYSCCFATRGFLRSVIIDTQRLDFYFIPNELYEILTGNDKVLFPEILKRYGKENEDTINEYVSFLLEKDLAFFTTEPNAFSKISCEWINPRRISNAIIDIDESSTYNINEIVKELDELDCESLQIRIFCQKTFEFYDSLSNILNKTKQLKTVEIIMPYNYKFTAETNYTSILRKSLIINRLIIFNSPYNSEIFDEIGSILYFTKCNIDNEDHCGNILKEYFTTDLENIIEGLKYNTCLNKKVSIDRFGNIKNCPSMKNSFGKVGKTSIIDILKDPVFTNVWNINKDQIKICKDCEFRSICTDCRAYLQTPSDIYSKPLKCAYNPYTAIWES